MYSIQIDLQMHPLLLIGFFSWPNANGNFQEIATSLRSICEALLTVILIFQATNDTSRDVMMRHRLRSWLNKNMKIKMTDGRTLIGIFLCTDKDKNVILGSCSEYLKVNGRCSCFKQWVVAWFEIQLNVTRFHLQRKCRRNQGCWGQLWCLVITQSPFTLTIATLPHPTSCDQLSLIPYDNICK